LRNTTSFQERSCAFHFLGFKPSNVKTGVFFFCFFSASTSPLVQTAAAPRTEQFPSSTGDHIHSARPPLHGALTQLCLTDICHGGRGPDPYWDEPETLFQSRCLSELMLRFEICKISCMIEKKRVSQLGRPKRSHCSSSEFARQTRATTRIQNDLAVRARTEAGAASALLGLPAALHRACILH